MPENYFDRATENRLAELAAEAGMSPYADIVNTALPLSQWRGNTVRLFTNWLTLIAAAKARRLASRTIHTRRRAS